MTEFAATEEYKGLIHHLLTVMFPKVDEKGMTEKIYKKLEDINKFKQLMIENYSKDEDVLNYTVQFMLMVENILLLESKGV